MISALAALEIGPGDEVLVPAYTWMATATAVLSCGAIPVLCEVDETLALDPNDARAKISDATKAIIAVHMAGRPADLESLLSLAREKADWLAECRQFSTPVRTARRALLKGSAGHFSCFTTSATAADAAILSASPHPC